MNRTCSRAHRDKPVAGVCPRCREIANEEREPVSPCAVTMEPTLECKGDYFPVGEWE